MLEILHDVYKNDILLADDPVLICLWLCPTGSFFGGRGQEVVSRDHDGPENHAIQFIRAHSFPNRDRRVLEEQREDDRAVVLYRHGARARRAHAPLEQGYKNQRKGPHPHGAPLQCVPASAFSERG
jgi:hypothetical protein